ncbi:AAA family ATPase [Paenibacillus sp. MMS18-CY102]|uniref:AAA family ATPase n=1 Tax=Paenibacillus sp. MMS18-CY102 TaxID=2682849 RepID=UPI001365ED3C|nr:AAA family ATPase [Paenibacillus sp. MMS18-CY102]MWC27720.1 AAA family ATPase [Paenibacillus sp. MMS18-CY102]
MKFVILFGPQAVGKMTVGRHLAETTGLKLFHNHMTIEMLSPIFDFGPETWRLTDSIRMQVFEAVSRSSLDGLIFTYVWAFNVQSDSEYIDKICAIFESQGSEIYLVELEADLDERLERNKTPYRLEQKPSKRNLEWSEQDLLSSTEQYRLNSLEGEITRKNYLRINNTHLKPEETAALIKETFGL